MAKEVAGVVLHAWLRTTIESSFTLSFTFLGHAAVAVTARPCLPLLPDGCDDGCGFRGTVLRAVAGCAGRGGRFVPQMPAGMPSSSSELSACLPPCARTLAERPQAQKQGSLIALLVQVVTHRTSHQTFRLSQERFSSPRSIPREPNAG